MNNIFKNIPDFAEQLNFKTSKSIQQGIKFKWESGSLTYRFEAHSIDSSAPTGSNAANGWVVRLQRSGGNQGKYFLGKDGKWYKSNIGNEKSPYYNPEKWNDTHIPIKDPTKDDDDDDNTPSNSGGSGKGIYLYKIDESGNVNNEIGERVGFIDYNQKKYLYKSWGEYCDSEILSRIHGRGPQVYPTNPDLYLPSPQFFLQFAY